MPVVKLAEGDARDVRRILQELDFYQFLSPAELAALIAGFEKTEIVKGETLITEGKSGEVFYILASGKVGVFLKSQMMDRRIATLEANSFFGEMSLLSEEPRSASVVCEEDGIAYTLSREVFLRVIMHNARLAELIRRTASSRKADTRSIEYSEWMARKIG
jgi:CRP-like cAMP-binding protein